MRMAACLPGRPWACTCRQRPEDTGRAAGSRKSAVSDQACYRLLRMMAQQCGAIQHTGVYGCRIEARNKRFSSQKANTNACWSGLKRRRESGENAHRAAVAGDGQRVRAGVGDARRLRVDGTSEDVCEGAGEGARHCRLDLWLEVVGAAVEAVDTDGSCKPICTPRTVRDWLRHAMRQPVLCVCAAAGNR